MSYTIALDGPLDPAPKMVSTVDRAQTFGDNIRSAARNLSDALDRAETVGRPEGWKGDAAQAADHAATQMATALDDALAALEAGATATTVFADALEDLARRHTDLEFEIASVNNARLDLEARITGASAEHEASLRGEAADYNRRCREARDRIAVWVADLAMVEADFVSALEQVDTVAEGARAADDPHRPDVDRLVTQLEDVKDDPALVAQTWAGLTERERQALTIARPGLVGNTGGVPSTDRDDANRAAVYSDIDRLSRLERSGDLTPEQAEALANARAIREQINLYRDSDSDVARRDKATGEELLHVLAYRPQAFGGDGGAAFAFGDPDSADYTAIAVPGFTTEVAPSAASNLNSAFSLYQEASALGQGTFSSITWFDYDAPSLDLNLLASPISRSGEYLDAFGVAQEQKAEDGGERLASFVDGLRASDQGERSHMTVIGHSYGSTTVASAAADSLPIDELVLLGSPGASDGVDHATDLMPDAGQVWVAAQRYDPVTWVGGEGAVGLGMDPATRAFGAQNLAVDDGPNSPTSYVDNHTSYSDVGSRPLAGTARVAVGLDPEVVAGRAQPGREWLMDQIKEAGKGIAEDGIELFSRGRVSFD